MAPERVFTFPRSHAEENYKSSPFNVSQTDVKALSSCAAFQVIRNSLLKQKDLMYVKARNKMARG